MKHTIKLFFVVAITGIAMFTACKDDEAADISLPVTDQATIDAEPLGGHTLININTDQAWTASVDVDWVRVSPVSGNGSGIINVDIDKHLGLRRTGKINFAIGSSTTTVSVLQKGQDTAKYLSELENRRIKRAIIDGTAVKIFWDKAPLKCVISELEYETLSGEFKTVTVLADESESECPDAKFDAVYRTRSGFIAPSTPDTVYKAWTASKSSIVSGFPTGTFFVHPRSYRYDALTGEPVAPVPLPEFETPRTVDIEAVNDGVYRISDLFGGYYTVGRGYSDPENNAYSPYGIFSVDGETYSLIEYGSDDWGYGFNKIDGYNNPLAGVLTLDAYWNNANYVFRLILCTESSKLDNDGYFAVDEFPFSTAGKYEFSAIRWQGNIGGWGEKYGVLAYKVTVPRAGKLKITDHVSPDRNIWFMVVNDKAGADSGDVDADGADGTVEYDVSAGTYYVFGILNTWYEDIAALSSINYDIEITLE